MEKKITLKVFKVLVHFGGPKRNAADITVKSALICTHQPYPQISSSLLFI